MDDSKRGLLIQLLLWGPIVSCLCKAFRYLWDRQHPSFEWTDDAASGELLVDGRYVPASPLPGTVGITGVKKEKKTDKTVAKVVPTSDWTAAGVVDGSRVRIHASWGTFDASVTKKTTDGGFEVQLHGPALPTADVSSATAELLACEVPMAKSHWFANILD